MFLNCFHQVDKSLLNFPFLTDDSTIKHVGESKVMFIMRGLPGSGKSTIMKLIAEKYKTTVTVCSADDYFLQEDGTYLYDKVCIITILQGNCRLTKTSL